MLNKHSSVEVNGKHWQGHVLLPTVPAWHGFAVFKWIITRRLPRFLMLFLMSQPFAISSAWLPCP